ncbi:MAG: DUF2066 domain-containing protein [Gammaproteobacteria bacterium]|nr:DUF2066 domain-containing protein [Gammaproteobacteria bacterium]
MPQFVNLKVKIFVFASLLFAFHPVLADYVNALYEVDVLVVDEGSDTRSRAFAQGLDEVFIRISGDSVVMGKLKRPPASRFVKQFSYFPVKNPKANETGELLSHRIRIQYNGTAMETYLRENGFPVWGERRANLVIWLVVRDGANEYVLKKTDQSLIKASLDDALKRRGIPESWPLYDAEDGKKLTVADIRGGFKDPVVKASKRYSRGPALTGSLIWNGTKWQSNWSLLMATDNRYWALEDTDYNSLINSSIDQVGDAMGTEFAISGVDKNKKLTIVRLDVQGVDSINSYHKAEDYLHDLSAVETVMPLQIDGQSAVFEVTLRSTEEDFLNLVKNDAELVEMSVTKPDREPLPPLPDVSSNHINTTSALPDVSKDQPVLPLIPLYYYKLIN